MESIPFFMLVQFEFFVCDPVDCSSDGSLVRVVMSFLLLENDDLVILGLIVHTK